MHTTFFFTRKRIYEDFLLAYNVLCEDMELYKTLIYFRISEEISPDRYEIEVKYKTPEALFRIGRLLGTVETNFKLKTT